MSYAQNNNSLRLKFLTARITIGAKSDSDKVVKINKWITRHIKYDVKGLIHHRLTRWSVRKILRRRKGLCKEYAFLFDAMCKQAGITSLTINGYSKSSFTDEDDVFFTEDHCWNTFKIDGKWYLSDLTWASGYLKSHFNMLYYYEYKMKLRNLPFKLKFKRFYDPQFLFTNSPEFWLTHFPNNEKYQLLNKKYTLSDFENFVFRQDTLTNYFNRNKENHSTECEFCNTQALENEVTKNYIESKEHLNENPRNIFSFVHNFVAYDKLYAKENPSDTNFLKEEIKRYSEMLPFLQCTKENINLDCKINLNQINHKNILFKANYIRPFKAELRQNQKGIRSNKYFLKKNAWFLFRNQYRYFFKYKSLLFFRILNPDPTKVQTKRDRKLLARYRNKKKSAQANAIATKNNINSIIRRAEERDSLIRFQMQNAKIDYEKNMQIEKILVNRMGGFDDTYDLDIIQIQDSILSIAHRISAYLNNVEVEIKNNYRQYRTYIKENKELVNNFKKYKKYIINCERHDTNSKPYVKELNAVDTIINNTLKEFLNQVSIRKSKIDEQLNINREIRILKNTCKMYMNEEYFYHYCRTIFEKKFVKGDRSAKKLLFKNDVKYHRVKLKVLNKQLKKERRKALKNKK